MGQTSYTVLHPADTSSKKIEDDGAGMTPECLLKLNSRNTEAGFGIYNVSERIRLAYGEEYGVTVESILGKGTKICICIPM